MRVTLIVAAARNNVIGRGGAMPWRLSSDLKRFKALTMGKPIIMGRKTFESIGRPLPGRMNIVVSSRPMAAQGVLSASGLEAAFRLAASLGDEVMIIGGARIYEAALPAAGRIHFTRVDAHISGDVRFPSWNRRIGGRQRRAPRKLVSRTTIVAVTLSLTGLPDAPWPQRRSAAKSSRCG